MDTDMRTNFTRAEIEDLWIECSWFRDEVYEFTKLKTKRQCISWLYHNQKNPWVIQELNEAMWGCITDEFTPM